MSKPQAPFYLLHLLTLFIHSLQHLNKAESIILSYGRKVHEDHFPKEAARKQHSSPGLSQISSLPQGEKNCFTFIP